MTSRGPAALRVSRAVVGDGIPLQGPSTGRVNLYATAVGVVRVDVGALERLNEHDGITLATLAAGAAVGEGKMVGPQDPALRDRGVGVLGVEAEATGRPPILRVDALPPRRAGLVLAGSRGAEERVGSGFRGGSSRGCTPWARRSTPATTWCWRRNPAPKRWARPSSVSSPPASSCAARGENAIMDRHDIAPRAVELAGGEVVCFGARRSRQSTHARLRGSVPVIGRRDARAARSATSSI